MLRIFQFLKLIDLFVCLEVMLMQVNYEGLHNFYFSLFLLDEFLIRRNHGIFPMELEQTKGFLL